MGAEGSMTTKFTDGFNPTKTRAHSRMSNAPLLVTELFLPKRFLETFLGDVSRHFAATFSCPWNSIRKKGVRNLPNTCVAAPAPVIVRAPWKPVKARGDFEHAIFLKLKIGVSLWV